MKKVVMIAIVLLSISQKSFPGDPGAQKGLVACAARFVLLRPVVHRCVDMTDVKHPGFRGLSYPRNQFDVFSPRHERYDGLEGEDDSSRADVGLLDGIRIVLGDPWALSKR